MKKRQQWLLGLTIMLVFTILINFSRSCFSSTVYAEGLTTETSVIVIATDTITYIPVTSSSTPTPIPLITSTSTSNEAQVLIGTVDVLGTLAMMQIELTKSASDNRDFRINIQPTLTYIETVVSTNAQQQENYSLMLTFVFCFAGIAILGIVIYALGISNKTLKMQKQLNTKTSPTQSANNFNNHHDLERRVELAEQEARNAKKMSQEVHTYVKDLEAKIKEYEKDISLFQSSHQSDISHNQEIRNERNLPSKIQEDVSSNAKVEVKDDLARNILHIYNRLVGQKGEKFVPLDRLIVDLIEDKIAKNEADVYKSLELIAKKYPRLIRIETIRGKSGQHIAFFEEYL